MTELDRRTLLGAGLGAGLRAGLLVLGGAGLAACATDQVGTATVGTSLITRPPGAGTTPGSGAPRAITSLAMVGDSLLRASAPSLTKVLPSSGVSDVKVDAETGRRIEVGNGFGPGPLSGTRTVQKLIDGGARPDAWLIVLGTNDVGSYGKADEYSAIIDGLLAVLAPQVPLVWMNVYRQQYPELSLLFNSVLQQQVAARGNALVADWHRFASATDQQVLRVDGTHPNTQGVQVMTNLLVQTLQRL